MPTLLVHGTEDVRVSWTATRRAHRRIPDAKLITIEGAGHAIPLHPGYGEAVERIR
ncbi:MAG: alpha/beta hydrolase, partial [Gemmatimonadetes bacterium]|nr:alpha/beta hydrolase [Gemmatimonadota bacterium]NIR81450.1 alpha/beta hydrolase [Gemmatimonadota bacterium]NIT90289.1 alpha/beta hydrolase [Gemmatimonadota bacterium]NIU34115.1 alpha/beta hydrolase [Gemmatimonadota bacterium]NIU38272.1 alpha/beta hydrolase [Gemmatimonadota bacterium]